MPKDQAKPNGGSEELHELNSFCNRIITCMEELATTQQLTAWALVGMTRLLDVIQENQQVLKAQQVDLIEMLRGKRAHEQETH